MFCIINFQLAIWYGILLLNKIIVAIKTLPFNEIEHD